MLTGATYGISGFVVFYNEITDAIKKFINKTIGKIIIVPIKRKIFVVMVMRAGAQAVTNVLKSKREFGPEDLKVETYKILRNSKMYKHLVR
jgi:hypothetical protein